MPGTGNGVTFALSVSTQPVCITKITMPELAIEDLESSCLSSTNFKEYVPSDLTEPGEVTIEYLVDATVQQLIARGAEEVLTVTWPIMTSGNTTNATFIADGYVSKVKLPDFANGELQTGSLTFKLNGADTEPAYTVESA